MCLEQDEGLVGFTGRREDMAFPSAVPLFCQGASRKEKVYFSPLLDSVSLSYYSICCSHVAASWFLCAFLGTLSVFSDKERIRNDRVLCLLRVLPSSIALLVYQRCLLGAALSMFSIIGDECFKVTVPVQDQ